jgi:tetratricopeptide (TPR) repeat protein
MIHPDQGQEDKKTNLSDRRKKSHFKVASRLLQYQQIAADVNRLRDDIRVLDQRTSADVNRAQKETESLGNRLEKEVGRIEAELRSLQATDTQGADRSRTADDVIRDSLKDVEKEARGFTMWIAAAVITLLGAAGAFAAHGLSKRLVDPDTYRRELDEKLKDAVAGVNTRVAQVEARVDTFQKVAEERLQLAMQRFQSDASARSAEISSSCERFLKMVQSQQASVEEKAKVLATLEETMRAKVKEITEAAESVRVTKEAFIETVSASGLPEGGDKIPCAALLMQVDAAFIDGDRQRAAALLSAILNEAKVDADKVDLHNAGLRAEHMEANDLARKIWELGHRRFPDDEALHRDYASILGRCGLNEDAEQEFAAARKAHPTDGMTLCLYATHLERIGKSERAAEVLASGVDGITDTRGLAYAKLGSLYGEQRSYDKADDCFAKAKVADPSDDRVYSEEASYWENRSDHPEAAGKALQAAEKAVTLVDKDESRYVGYLLRKARIFKDQFHDDARMESSLAEAMNAAPGDPNAQRVAFMMFRSRGMNDRARQVVEGKWPVSRAEQPPA